MKMEKKMKEKMKEMEYKPYELNENGGIKSEILCTEIYHNIPYVVISYFDHPCAYIVNPFNNLTSYFDEKLDDIIVHGGFTFFGDLKQILPENFYLFQEKFLGWDYAHAGDYCECIKHFNFCGNKYSTSKIVQECKRVIDQILDKYLDTNKLKPFVYKGRFDDIVIPDITTTVTQNNNKDNNKANNKSKYITEMNITNTNTSKKLFDICDNILDVINMALQGNNFDQAKEALILCKNGLELYEQTFNKAKNICDKENKKGVLIMNDMPNKEIIDTMPMQNANHKKYDYDYIREQIQTAISALEQVKDSMSYRSNLFDKTTNKPINYDAKQYIEDIIINLDNFLYNFSIVVPKDPKIFL